MYENNNPAHNPWQGNDQGGYAAGNAWQTGPQQAQSSAGCTWQTGQTGYAEASGLLNIYVCARTLDRLLQWM